MYAGAVNAATYNAFVENQLLPRLHEIDADRNWLPTLSGNNDVAFAGLS